MSNELVRKVAKRVYENSGGAVGNYVMLEGLIRRFLQLNPDADPETIDWSAVWDDRLEYDELVQAFAEQYPMHRWWDETVPEEAYNGDRVRDIAAEVATKLDVEDFDKLIDELQRIREEALGDIRQIEVETPKVEQVSQEAETITPEQPKPVEKPVLVSPKQETVTPEPPKPTPGPPILKPPEKPAEVKVTLTLLAKYPFLNSAVPFLRAYKLHSAPQEVRRRSVERILEALERGERGVLPRLENPWLELLSFPYSRALVLYVGDDWLRRRWALAEAARVERLLHREDDNVLKHVIDDLQLKVSKEGEGWVMHFTQYLALAKRLTTEPRFKLINRLLDKGRVSLSRPELIRLVREKLYDNFSEERTLPANWSPEEVGVIREALQKRASRMVAPAPSREWAPCMVAVRNRVADAGHFALFALAAYMANKGYEVNEIVDVLRVRSDFDERIARYQVEHIAGLRGSRVKYRPPSCQSMKTHGLCIDNGRNCPFGIRNPLQYRQPTVSAGPK